MPAAHNLNQFPSYGYHFEYYENREMGLMYELKLNQSIYQGIFILPFMNINQAFLYL